MLKITAKTIPHNAQRYPTVGDWEIDGITFDVKVSELNNWRMEWLIAVHEIIEAGLCTAKQITAKDVDKFDMSWVGDGEPGDDSNAPYFHQHQTASVIERLLAAELDIDWAEYEACINELQK